MQDSIFVNKFLDGLVDRLNLCLVAITVNVDRDIAEHILPLVRGLKLSRDLDLAEKAIQAERELTDKLNKSESGNNGRRKAA
jgi:hypothetical protein